MFETVLGLLFFYSLFSAPAFDQLNFKNLKTVSTLGTRPKGADSEGEFQYSDLIHERKHSLSDT